MKFLFSQVLICKHASVRTRYLEVLEKASEKDKQLVSVRICYFVFTFIILVPVCPERLLLFLRVVRSHFTCYQSREGVWTS